MASTKRARRISTALLALSALLGPLSLAPGTAFAAGSISTELITPTGVSCCDNLTLVGTRLFFSATDSTHGLELWSSDGTKVGTHMVKDINPKGNSRPMSFQQFGSTLYFLADDGSHKASDPTSPFKWWSSDGTKNGTQAVKSLLGSKYSSFSSPIRVGSKTITFGENNVGSDASSTELWASDGTAKGTSKVAKLNLHGQSDRPVPYVFKSKLFFQSTDTSKGPELWSTDGTVKGTKIIKKFAGNSYIDFCCSIGTKLYFAASSGADGAKLWSTDGTVAGTQMISKDVTTESGGDTTFGAYAVSHSRLYFTGHGASGGNQIWSTDGTTAGTQVVTNLDTKTYGGLYNFTSIGSKLYFTASVYDPATGAAGGVAMLSADGTPAGTQLVKVINPSPYSGIRQMAAIGSNLYIPSSPKDNQGLGLWISDGTTDGTQLVSSSDFSVGTDVTDLVAMGSNLFLVASNGAQGSGLWKLSI